MRYQLYRFCTAKIGGWVGTLIVGVALLFTGWVAATLSAHESALPEQRAMITAVDKRVDASEVRNSIEHAAINSKLDRIIDFLINKKGEP